MLSNCVLEKTLESPLNSKESKLAAPKGNQPWLFIARTVAEAPMLWPSDVKSQVIGESLDSGKDWGQEEKGVAEEEIVGWHRRLSGHEFEQTLEDSEGRGGLERCSPRGDKKSDTTKWLNSKNNKQHLTFSKRNPWYLWELWNDFKYCYQNECKKGF